VKCTADLNQFKDTSLGMVGESKRLDLANRKASLNNDWALPSPIQLTISSGLLVPEKFALLVLNLFVPKHDRVSPTQF
jgi:hypothetical protein